MLCSFRQHIHRVLQLFQPYLSWIILLRKGRMVLNIIQCLPASVASVHGLPIASLSSLQLKKKNVLKHWQRFPGGQYLPWLRKTVPSCWLWFTQLLIHHIYLVILYYICEFSNYFFRMDSGGDVFLRLWEYNGSRVFTIMKLMAERSDRSSNPYKLK